MAEGGTPAPNFNLKVKESGGGEISFRVKATTPMSKVIDAYCGRKAIDKQSVVFLFDGNRVVPEDTPEGLDMEDGDVLDVVFHQVGGGDGSGGKGDGVWERLAPLVHSVTMP